MKLTYIFFSYQLTMSYLCFIFLILFTIFFRGVFSFEAERSFSTLHRLMTWLRSTIGSGRLCNLARMHMPSDIFFTKFLMKKPRNNLFKINLEFFNFEEVLLKLLIIFVNSRTVSIFKYHFLNLFLTVVNS